MVGGAMKGVTWEDDNDISSSIAKIYPFIELSFTQQIKETNPNEVGNI